MVRNHVSHALGLVAGVRGAHGRAAFFQVVRALDLNGRVVDVQMRADTVGMSERGFWVVRLRVHTSSELHENERGRDRQRQREQAT